MPGGSSDLLCLYTAELVEENGSYLVDVPEHEVTTGQLEEGEPFRVGFFPSTTPRESSRQQHRTETSEAPDSRDRPRPPVEEGEERTVDIEGLGEQGDGIARVERGYVVIVPDAEKGERVRVRIETVKENVAFAEVIEKNQYYL